MKGKTVWLTDEVLVVLDRAKIIPKEAYTDVVLRALVAAGWIKSKADSKGEK